MKISRAVIFLNLTCMLLIFGCSESKNEVAENSIPEKPEVVAEVKLDYFLKPPLPNKPAYSISTESVEFKHPMTVINVKDRATVLNMIAQKVEPQYSEYQKLIAEAEKQLVFIPLPPATMDIKGGYEEGTNLEENRELLWSNCHAAYTNALAYTYSGEKKYAQKAMEILMAWTKKDTKFSGADSGLQLGSYFTPMLYAADLIHDFDGWSGLDRSKFKSWWKLRCLQNGAVLDVMREKDNNWKDAAILGAITAAVVFEDRSLLKEALIQQTSYFYDRTDAYVRNPGVSWKFSKNQNGAYMDREVVRNDGSSGLTYTAYALTTMVQHFEIASYFGYDFWNAKTSDGTSIKDIIEQYYKWDILNESFKWNINPKKTTTRRNLYEVANNHFNLGNDFRVWLKITRPIDGSQGDEYATLNKGDLYLR